MNRYVLFGIWAAISFIADLATKIWARAALAPIYPKETVVIQDYFHMRYSENTGSAFGLFRSIPGSRYFLAIIGVVALVVVFGYLRKITDKQRALATALGLVAGGAVGNILDRVVYGKVTDFIVWKWKTHEWPTFNVADAALVAGVILLAIAGGGKKDEAEAEAKAKAG